MDRNLTSEEQEKVANCGAFGYDIKTMAVVLNIDSADLEKIMKDEKSEISILYKKGKILREYVLMTKLFEMAKSGDIKAMDKLEQLERRKAGGSR